MSLISQNQYSLVELLKRNLNSHYWGRYDGENTALLVQSFLWVLSPCGGSATKCGLDSSLQNLWLCKQHQDLCKELLAKE